MNRTLVVAAVVGLVALAVGGLIFLHVVSPDSTGAFVLQVTTLVGLATTFAVTSYGLGKVNAKVEEVRTNTNGTLTRRDDEIAALRAENEELRQAEDRRLRAAHRAEGV